MSALRVTIRAHHALSRCPLEEVRVIVCQGRCQVAAALADIHDYCRSLIGRGTIRRVELLRERLP
jgi:hypothetical protein